ncbi:hypothetical protein C2845_PM01G00710 [Panicum miliaceum]|uniref:Peptidase C1A papain C-terminal domain-containing protein n=1 Tax=Panicum miliaceum TaxID=4540 RepID=A0A3L6TY17_PANMI|nr:hypothetical protein C2845_PM01G00710 [Panicum miliaceum]
MSQEARRNYAETESRTGVIEGPGGGFTVKAFQYIIDNDGLASAATYPYTARQGTCQAADKSLTFHSTMDGYELVPSFHNA